MHIVDHMLVESLQVGTEDDVEIDSTSVGLHVVPSKDVDYVCERRGIVDQIKQLVHSYLLLDSACQVHVPSPHQRPSLQVDPVGLQKFITKQLVELVGRDRLQGRKKPDQTVRRLRALDYESMHQQE